ncbi:hypothetical protein KFE25_008311 [Diacronema lutheri]|uniref:Uncharacterized protein n=2 Tax=Diacronema lutheri TaxID=2081491 RepID=A0A8J5XPJ6_DIALT|nr:hypothetical protein KFE25_008311 [Diacronema lutheri]
MGYAREAEDEHDALLARPPLAAASAPARDRRACMAIVWLASLVGTALVFRAPADAGAACAATDAVSEPLPTYGTPPQLEYAAWPAAQTASSAQTMRAIGYGVKRPPRVDAERIARKLAALGAARAPTGGAAVLVIAGGFTGLGLGNTFCGLTAAAVVAEAIGAACLVTLGETYAKTLQKHVSDEYIFASPCQIVSLGELDELRAQTVVPVVKNTRWRIAGFWNVSGDGRRPAAGGAYVIDYGIKYRELVCMPRFDTAKLLAPPGMAAGEFWRRLRAKYEQWVHVSLRLPIEPHERRISAPAPPWEPRQGTLCGHMRLLHLESHRPAVRRGPPKGPSCGALDCGGLLSAFEAVHAKRPFASFFFTAGANCSHCLPDVAPTLLRDAERIESGHKSRHIVEKATFDDAEGAMADMRALSRCALVIVDDKAEGTFALSLAAAGRLTPCIDPLEMIERWQPGYGLGGHFAHVRGTVNLARWRARALCATTDPAAPVTPLPWPLAPNDLAALRDGIRFDVARPWDPAHLPPPGTPPPPGDEPYIPPACDFVMRGWDTPSGK